MDNSKNIQQGGSEKESTRSPKSQDITNSLSKVSDTSLAANAVMNAAGQMPPVMSASDIARSVLRHKFLLVIIFLLVAVPALALIWTQVVPKYQATAQIRVRPIIPFLVFKTEDSGTIPLYSSYVQTQSSIIKTETVLNRVLELPQIRQAQWYTNPQISFVDSLTKAPIDRLKNLKGSLSATPVKDTELINLSFVDVNPADAQLLLNSVLDQYMNYVSEMSDDTQDKLYDALVNQYKTLEGEIQGREKVTAELRQRLGTSAPEELISGQRVRLDEAQARLTDVQQNIKILEWEINQIKSIDSNDTQVSLEPNNIDENQMKQLLYFTDNQWSQLDTNVKNMQHTIATTSLTKQNPDYVKLQEELAFAEDLLKKRQDQLDLQWQYNKKELMEKAKENKENVADESLDFLKNLPLLEYELGKAKYQEQLVDSDLKVQQKVFEELFTSAQSLENENTTLEQKHQIFDAVRQRLEQKTMERKAPGSIEILSRASVSGGPYQDRRIMLSAVSLFFAFSLASGLAYLKDKRNGIVTILSDLPYPMQVTLLGYIPQISSVKQKKGLLSSLTGRAKPNLQKVMDSIRIVRTSLLSRLNDQTGTTILVTSSCSGSDKTDFTMMLSASLSQAGKKVLVIDADFQEMALTRQCPNVPENHGFIHALRRKDGYEQDIFPTEMPNLHILPAGDRSDNMVLEEIAGASLGRFIDHVRSRYDVVLVDSAPILSLADTAILSTRMDGTILVERQFQSRQEDTISALSRLASAGGRLLGTVIIGSEN